MGALSGMMRAVRLHDEPEQVGARIVRNAAWLFCSEGITKSLFFVANILLARMLSAANYGVLALAQSWVLYAGIGADLGIMMYGQAEAARRRDTTALAWELIPFRALLGALVFIGLLVVAPFLVSSSTLRITVLAASIYLLGQAISAEWLFRGKERFDIVMIGNGAGAATFLVAVALIGNGSGALLKDALAWSLSAFAMAAVYLLWLPQLISLPRKLRISTAAWSGHFRESGFFALSNIIAGIVPGVAVLSAGCAGCASRTGTVRGAAAAGGQPGEPGLPDSDGFLSGLGSIVPRASAGICR